MICFQVISEASLTTATSIPQIHEKERKKEREKGREGGRKKEREKAQTEELKSHFWSYYRLCLAKAAEEGSSIPPESPNVEFSSNLPQHCFTWFLF